MKKLTALLLVLLVLFTFTACGETEKTQTDAETVSQTTSAESTEKEVSFKFTVVGVDGNEKEFTVKTDKDTVGAALLEEGLIAGEEGPYGLYVKTVDGTTLDYDKDGKYWAFYIDGEYAMTGVDATEIEEGKTYTFKAE